MNRNVPAVLGSLAAALSTACVSIDYDLASVPVPISAKPADPGAAEVVPFRLEARNVLWFDGLFGRTPPDVAALVVEQARGYDRIADFKVSQETNVHQWLLTHLTLSLVRMKTVVVRGQLVRDAVASPVSGDPRACRSPRAAPEPACGPPRSSPASSRTGGTERPAGR